MPDNITYRDSVVNTFRDRRVTGRVHTYAMPFPDRLKALRLQRNLTQEALSLACGWAGQSRIGNYESGKREPSLTELLRLANTLGVSAAELLGETPTPAGSASHFGRLNHAIITEAKKWIAAEERIGGEYSRGELVDELLAVYELMLENGGNLTSDQRKKRLEAATLRLAGHTGEQADGRGSKAVGA